jgi:hypothetical protein
MPFNNLTLGLLWTGRGCPDSGRLRCSGRVGGVQSECKFEGKDWFDSVFGSKARDSPCLWMS